MAHPWLGKLLELQTCDLRIFTNKRKLDFLPGDLKELLGKRDALLKAVDDAAKSVKKIELEIKSGESDIKKLDDDNRKLQQQSAMVKKNTEYQAMLATIEDNKRKTGEIEEEILAKFDELENAKREFNRVKQENAAALKMVKADFDDVVAFGDTLKKELATLEKERPAKVNGIIPDVLRRYTALMKKPEAGAPVCVVENGICTRCHMRVTAQTLNQLQKGEVVECDNCQGMLYDPERVEL